MGLDMYLDQRVYVGAEYEHRNITGTVEIQQNGTKLDIPFKRIKEITLNAGYWRKANQIHKWFVDNVQEGNDDCKAYYVLPENLQKLKRLCQAILDAKGDERKRLIEETLPPESGFFFGNAEVGSKEGMEYYIQDIEETVLIIDKTSRESDYWYRSSW